MNLNYEKAREVMVKNQLRPNKIKEERILKLFKSTPKEIFVEEDQKKFCYSDQDLSISTGRGYLKNLHLAQIMRSAEINKNDKILHIGGLTGYLSIMMAKICDNIFVIGFVAISKYDFVDPKFVFANSDGIGWIEEDGSFESTIFNTTKENQQNRKSIIEIANELV